MKKLSLLAMLSILAGAFSAASVFASRLSAEDQEALQKTQDLLRNPQALMGPQGNADEKAALMEIQKLTNGNPGAAGKIHSLSADIFGDIVKKANGDPATIQKMLLEAQKDPNGFMRGLSSSQQAEIQKLAAEIDAKNSKR